MELDYTQSAVKDLKKIKFNNDLVEKILETKKKYMTGEIKTYEILRSQTISFSRQNVSDVFTLFFKNDKKAPKPEKIRCRYQMNQCNECST